MLFDIGNINKYINEAEFGIERESLRVSADGSLAQTPHPFESHKNIDRDFCENQIEFISDVFNKPEQVNEQLWELQRLVNGKLKENGEFLWSFSNPPRISGENEIPVAEYTGSLRNKSVYRRYLAKKYGKIKMLFSGIHLNFSFTQELIKTVFEQSEYNDFNDFKNDLYLKLAARLTEYAWLVVYLTAASPVSDDTVGTESNIYSSIRCSERGYWNYFTPILDYSNLQRYTGSIQKYIDDGNLRSVSELYYPVRIKPRGANSLEALAKNGINHIELRVIDVNPLTSTGIFTEDIKFIHLLMLYLVSLPEHEFTGTEQIKAINDIKAAAVFGNNDIKHRAEKVLGDIKSFALKYFPQYSDVIEYQIDKTHSGNSYAEIVSRRFGSDYMNKGIALAREYQRSVGYV
jgi:glutamate--cysteine ligase